MSTQLRSTGIGHRDWTLECLRRIEADHRRSADTRVIKLRVPGLRRKTHDLYLKDESAHPSGSLKHRLAHSLFVYALVNGWLNPGRPVIEASSGSTAISEAYFANLINLPFIAVIPSSTAAAKVAAIEALGGKVHLVDADIYSSAEGLARSTEGHYMNQFLYAERAKNYRGGDFNLAARAMGQMELETFCVPRWFVCGAGTGGTASTAGRYFRYKRLDTRVCVVDPENSVFHEYFRTRDESLTSAVPSLIEGIGRGRVEPSFVPSCVDRVDRVPDAASIAMVHFLKHKVGLVVGGSTGTNVYGCFRLLAEMQAAGETGSVLSVLCDSGERYSSSYFDPGWLQEHGLSPERLQPFLDQIELFWEHGNWTEIGSSPEQVGSELSRL